MLRFQSYSSLALKGAVLCASILIGVVAPHPARAQIQSEIESKLSGLKTAPQKQGVGSPHARSRIETFFGDQLKRAINTVKNDPRTGEALKKFHVGAILNSGHGDDGIEWFETQKIYRSWFQEALRKYDFQEIYLISNGGDLVYSTRLENDPAVNVLSDSLKNTGLGKAFQLVNVTNLTQAIFVAGLQLQTPSGSRPAAFLASRIAGINEKSLGVFIVRISSEKINEVPGD